MKDKECTNLYKYQSPNIEKLFEIYRKDKYHARVFFMNGEKTYFHELNLYKFEDGDDVDYVLFRKHYGISKTNVIYNNERVEFRLRVRKNGIWICKGKSIRSLVMNDYEFEKYDRGVKNIIVEELKVRFGWYRFLTDEFKNYDKPLTYVIKNGLTTKKALIKNYYGFDWPLSYELYNIDRDGTVFRATQFYQLQHYKEWINNENKFNIDLVKGNWTLFLDSLRMAKKLDKKINFRWDITRLKDEHNKMAIELTKIVYSYDTTELTNAQVFLDFENEYDRGLVMDMPSLSYEGVRLNHCVVSYKQKINSGHCGIYSIGDYTLELVNMSRGLEINQFQGHSNQNDPPKKLYNEIQRELDLFNEKNGIVVNTNKAKYYSTYDGVYHNQTNAWI